MGKKSLESLEFGGRTGALELKPKSQTYSLLAECPHKGYLTSEPRFVILPHPIGPP